MAEPAPPVVCRRTRRPRRSTKEIRSLILSAARALFAEYGYAGTTTRKIAEHAGVTEALIFSNFGNKVTLFEESVVAPFNMRFMEFLERSNDMPPDRERRSAFFVHTVYPFLRDNASLLHALIKATNGNNEASMEDRPLYALEDYFSRAGERMRSQYEKDGLQLDIDPELFVRYSFGMLAGAVLFRDWFFPDRYLQDDKAEDTLARMLFKAAAPAGREEP